MFTRFVTMRRIHALVVSAVLTTLSASFWSSVLLRLCDSDSPSSFVGDADRFLEAVVDDVVTSIAFLLSLLVLGTEASSGLNCTITAVILSQPVPSPTVLGAKQAVNSCKPPTKGRCLNLIYENPMNASTNLFTNGRHFGLAFQDSASYKFDDFFAAQRIPDAVAGQNHEFVFCGNCCPFDIWQSRYHLFFGFQIFVLQKGKRVKVVNPW